jgi:hypothetical protein
MRADSLESYNKRVSTAYANSLVQSLPSVNDLQNGHGTEETLAITINPAPRPGQKNNSLYLKSVIFLYLFKIPM